MSRASSSMPTSTRPARTMSASISWSRATTGCRSASPRSPAWSRAGSCPSSRKATGSRPASAIGLIRFGSRVDVYLPAGTGSPGAARPAHDRRRDDPRRDRRRSAALAGSASDRPARAAAAFPFRALVPNAITALALVLRPDRRPLRRSPANGRRRWPASSVAGVLDGFDGRIARLLRAQSKFGAELDSLSATISRSARRRR